MAFGRWAFGLVSKGVPGANGPRMGGGTIAVGRRAFNPKSRAEMVVSRSVTGL
jgi:hypothetical protein